MRKTLVATLPLILVVACTRPEVEAFRKNPGPISVKFTVPASVPAATDVAKEYAAAMRARLATRVTVVPEGQSAPAGSVELQVTISEGRRGAASPGAVGAITGIAVGTLSALSGNRDAAFDGFFWGMWAGTNAAEAQDRERERLGYRPQRVNAVVSLAQPGVREPLWEFAIRSYEVIDAMDPLRGPDREDEARIREEEARAFARVVVGKLQDRFQWMTRSEPSFYRPEGWKPPELKEEPKPEPKDPEAPKPTEEPKPVEAPATPENPK